MLRLPLLLALARGCAVAPIAIDAGTIVARVSRYMTGAGIEDVNHELYGGIYAQMVFGESFEEPANPDADPDVSAMWRREGDGSFVAEKLGAYVRFVIDKVLVPAADFSGEDDGGGGACGDGGEVATVPVGAGDAGDGDEDDGGSGGSDG